VVADDCFGLAAELAYYFFLALFPALLFLVALISFVPIDNLLTTITDTLGRVAPGEVLGMIQDQVLKIAQDENGGLLTLGMIGTLWSSSSGLTAVIETLNRAYDIHETRSWWKVRLTALLLTVALAAFIITSTVLVVAGPALAEQVAQWFRLGSAFEWTWKVLQWPLVFALVSLGIALVYYYAPDAEQEWIWITPGSILSTTLWLIVSVGFRFYVANFGSYTETYGAIGGVIVVLLWFYLSGLAILVGAELNAEIEHASPYGKDPGERVPGEKVKIGPLAEREWEVQHRAGVFRPALAAANCEIDRDLPPSQAPPPRPVRASEWVLSGVALAQVAAVLYIKLRRSGSTLWGPNRIKG
jgi:membrane protein